jgi:hypothetical protein
MRFTAIFFLAILLLSSCDSTPGKLRAPVKVDGKFGYIDEKGNFLVDPKFQEAWSFIRSTAVVKENGKYGLIDKSGNYVLEPVFDSVIPFSASCFIGVMNSQFGFFEHGTGKEIIRPQYEMVYKYTDELCVVQKGRSLGIVNPEGKLVCPVVLQDFREMFGPGAIVVKQDTSDEVSMLLSLIQGGGGAKLGLINNRGELIVEPEYDEFFDDLPNGFYYPFTRDSNAAPDSSFVDENFLPPGQYGIIDTTGKLIAKPQFNEMPVYGDGLFRVRIGDKYGYIDREGKLAVRPEYDYAVAFSEGKAIVSANGKSAIINKSGKILADNLGPGAGMYRFSCGLARCRSVDAYYGFLDSTGTRVIQPQFDAADDFENNRAIVSIQGQYGLIDLKGEFIIRPQFDFLYDLGGGYYQTKDLTGKVGVIDSTGKTVLDPKYDEVFHLQNPWLIVEMNTLNGCYDLRGKEIYPPVSALHIYFINGRCTVTDQTGNSGIIDSTGRIIVPVEYDSVGFFYKGYTTVRQNKKYGVIDSTGKVIITPRYEEVQPMVNGFAVFRENGKFGYLDKNGEVVIDAKFEQASVLLDPDRKDFE